MKKISRRDFIKTSALAAAGAAASGFRWSTPSGQTLFLRKNKLASRIMALGVDGMDPVLLRRFVAEGVMPNFEKLMRSGYFGELRTTMPPQSPVAWASFISGTNPGGHGIYDFVHRDPKTFSPYLSTSRSFGSKKSIELGKWALPLKAGRVELLREGRPFWSILEENDIPASLFQIPANFPVEESDSVQISGMGTPDLLGSYGTYTLFSEVDIPGSKNFTGGRVVRVKARDHLIKAKLTGPENPFRSSGELTEMDVVIRRDPWEQSAKIEISGHALLMQQGEWSEWIPISFDLLPHFASVAGMVRLYLQQVHPHLRLYLTPINIDPLDPELPICSPREYSREQSHAVGRFYTQGFPEDTKALSTGIFSNDEYFRQAQIVLEERMRAFEYEFNRFDEGFFFFYFSSVDQNSHVMYRLLDPTHPLYEPNASEQAKQAVKYFYRRMDDVLGQMFSKADSRTTLMVLSDHGFAPFRREVNLSTWLAKEGFTALNDPARMDRYDLYKNVDWSKTKAYVLGLNGIYINIEGREQRGSVKPEQVTQIKQQIIARLKELRDPLNGAPAVVQAYDTSQIYSGPFTSLAPDIVVGYQSGYRISDESVLGKFPKEVVSDRLDKWSADHCMDPSVVPGVLLTNRQVAAPQPALWDLAPSILQAFGIPKHPAMDGDPIFKA